ncbi:hypothetical protein ACTFIV_010764 [Dictyostelium citrinum]
MTKEIIFFIIFIFCFEINSIFSIKDDNTYITLVVNPNENNNRYQPGGQCGNSTTFPCNNMIDALEYFKTIATIQNPTNSTTMHQRLNLKLADAIYTVSENSVNLYEFDIMISPLNSSGDVVFNGLNANSPLFTIVTQSESSSTDRTNQYVIQSSVIITGISFKNFTQAILDIDGNSISYFTFDQCIFNDFNSSSSSMIEAGIYLSPSSSSSSSMTSNIIISNSLIENAIVRFETPLINIVKTSIKFENNKVSNISNNKEIIISNQGYVTINNSSFVGNSGLRGVVFSSDSTVSLTESSFIGNIGLNTSSVLSFTTAYPKKYSFNIENCQFINNKDNYGVIFASYTSQDTTSTPNYVIGSTFTGNSAKENGAAISAYSLPVSIENSIFKDNNALSGGPALYMFSANLTITNSSIFTNATQPKIKNIERVTINGVGSGDDVGQLLYSFYSTIYIRNVSFEIVQNGFICDNSEMTFENEEFKFDPSFVVSCESCNAKNNGDEFCSSEPSITGDYTSGSSSTTSGDYTTSPWSSSTTSSSTSTSSSSSSSSSSTTSSPASQNSKQICKLMILLLSLISLFF